MPTSADDLSRRGFLSGTAIAAVGALCAAATGPAREDELVDLARRCSFGAYTGSSVAHAALEAKISAQLPRYVTFRDMGTSGASGWPAEEASWCAATGHTLVISWDMPADGPTFADLLNGANDASLDAFFLCCRDSFPGRVVLRMWWEMNDPHGPTKVGAPTALVADPEEWVRAWRYVHARSRALGCTNVDFFWCANGRDGGVPMEKLFPGTDFVDRVGFDVYNDVSWGPWREFDDLMEPAYSRITRLAPGLPLGLGETGTFPIDPGDPSEHNTASYLRGMLTSRRWPALHFVDFFSVRKEADWRIDATRESTDVCRRFLGGFPSVDLPGGRGRKA